MTARTRLAALLTVPALALTVLTACGEDDPVPASGSATKASDPADDPTEDPADQPSSAAPSESESESADSGTTTVPVYFVGETPQGLRLYREFRSVEGDPATGALGLMTSGDALDPDYRTLFPGGSFASVEVGSDAITVGLPDESWTRMGEMTAKQARLAGQQLVYTAQGVAGSRLPVKVTLDGKPADLFGIGGELTNEPEVDVRALVNITAPEEGATVDGVLKAAGVASSFEATTPWESRRGGADGKVVKKGFATAEGWMDKLYPWAAEVDVSGLPAGDYTFVASTDDPSEGEGGGPQVDTKSITIG